MREGCWTDDPNVWRGRATTSLMQAGWRNLHRGTEIVREAVMVPVTTEWIPKSCGILPQDGFDDPGCAGCALYPKKETTK